MDIIKYPHSRIKAKCYLTTCCAQTFTPYKNLWVHSTTTSLLVKHKTVTVCYKWSNEHFSSVANAMNKQHDSLYRAKALCLCRPLCSVRDFKYLSSKKREKFLRKWTSVFSQGLFRRLQKEARKSFICYLTYFPIFVWFVLPLVVFLKLCGFKFLYCASGKLCGTLMRDLNHEEIGPTVYIKTCSTIIHIAGILNMWQVPHTDSCFIQFRFKYVSSCKIMYKNSIVCLEVLPMLLPGVALLKQVWWWVWCNNGTNRNESILNPYEFQWCFHKKTGGGGGHKFSL